MQIVDAKIGTVSPRLISPKNFIAGLRTIHTNFFYQELPFPLQENYYLLYMKISKINIILSGGKLVTVQIAHVAIRCIGHEHAWTPKAR